MMHKREFRSWVASLEPQSRRWTRFSASGCPVARYIQDRTGCDAAVSRVSYVSNGRRKRLPQWAKDFVHWFDHTDEEDILTPTAQQVLEYLS